MNKYVLVQRAEDGTRVLGHTVAGTQGQAQRKLYRAHKVPEKQAQALGYAVQFQPATGPQNAASNS